MKITKYFVEQQYERSYTMAQSNRIFEQIMQSKRTSNCSLCRFSVLKLNKRKGKQNATIWACDIALLRTDSIWIKWFAILLLRAKSRAGARAVRFIFSENLNSYFALLTDSPCRIWLPSPPSSFDLLFLACTQFSLICILSIAMRGLNSLRWFFSLSLFGCHYTI